MRHNKNIIEKAKELYESGHSKYKIEKELELKKGTVYYWVKQNFSVNQKTEDLKWLGEYEELKVEEILKSDELIKAYSYMLGIYLSDGYLVEMKAREGVYRMRLFNDVKYPINSEEWKCGLEKLFPNNSVTRSQPKDRNIWLISVYSKYLPILFPHVGEGRKHERTLNIQDWQKNIIEKEPEKFIKGCIESDGSIYVQRVDKKYSYTQYSFSNNSEEIIDLFLFALSKVGIEKNKYFNIAKGQFVIQSFNAKQLKILNKIVPVKH